MPRTFIRGYEQRTTHLRHCYVVHTISYIVVIIHTAKIMLFYELHNKIYKIALDFGDFYYICTYEACEASEKDINGSDKYPGSRTAGRKFELFV